ncbi:hypothetical protein ALP45_100659 [Pseudomonas coronafaciens pv. atropurpurea]|uniref:hypothetical protein n=1 Tax=Pseudomonas coronafaciens TaxID=53409 RepID=UPI0006D602CB|nr:hypothetical protein [Pseudomonas coronafaciens]KPW33092.1 Uncharacterized protein ALO66_00425 [Pseudomonas coronafaciens pv. atropurpurea]RMT60760.1 hypothetical protein ALP45_100659 [Pseudomonas coronafaciens pv. atropurpurea]
MTDISLLFFDPHILNGNIDTALVAIVDTEAAQARYADNGLFIPSGALHAHWLSNAHHTQVPMPMKDFDFQVFSAAQRKRTQDSRSRMHVMDPSQHRRPSDQALLATLAVIHQGNKCSVYHYVHEGEAGALFLHLLDVEPVERTSWRAWQRLARTCTVQVAISQPIISDDCWYVRWRPEMELERKFTSFQIPDMWQLSTAMHKAFGEGAFQDLILEIDRDFQTYDYESHIFEVTGEPSETGYIAFIPQADGLMAVKRKWFLENAELRREDFNTDQPVAFADIEAHARSMTPADLCRLKPFRRTRIDINFESLKTGNGFGAYFDVCRMVDGSAEFAQVEVEYCRSRTLHTLREVEEDFETVSNVMRDFLAAQGLPFQQDLYSKLDFAREASRP